MLHICHARNVYEIVLEKHSMSLNTPDEAPENDSCYECIASRIRQAAATNYQPPHPRHVLIIQNPPTGLEGMVSNTA